MRPRIVFGSRSAIAFAALIAQAACSPAVTTPSASPRGAFAVIPVGGTSAGPQSSAPAASAPLSLIADDSTPIRLAELTVNIHVHGPLARTAVHATFWNTSSSTLEGRFRMTLPPRSSVSRLAMKISGEWREADAAEIGAARETYEEILHRRRDPLLVEQRREREISARVFPIDGSSAKEIAIEYISEVGGADAPVWFPLRGLPAVHKLDVSVIEGATEPIAIHLEDDRPTADVSFVAPRSTGAEVARAGELVALRVPTFVAKEPDPLEGAVVFVVETSAAKEGTLEAAASLVGALASSSSGRTRAAVVAYDQSTERLYDGDLASLSAALPKALAARGALGVADLERGLEAARVEAKRIRATRVIIVGGGVGPTADGARLRVAMGELAKAGVERVDVLGTSALADLRLYRPLVTSAIFARDGVVIDDAPRLSPETVQARVRSRVAARVPVSVEGATWTSTAALEAASPDETRVVLARVPSSAPLRAHIGGKVHSVDASAVTAAPSPMLEHVSAVAKLDALIAHEEEAATKDAWKSEIVAIARKNKLASPFTSLIVLENDSDVARMRSREASSSAAPPPPPPPSPSTPSAPARGHVTKAPAMRQATTTVSGRVPPEVIQRIVRQRWGALRACYEDGLRRRGEFSGRVSVKFVVTHDGSVGTAMDAGSDISDKKTIECVVDVFRHLVFPAPDGNITVVYPLMLAPITAEDEASPPAAHLPVKASTIWSPFRSSAGAAAPPSPAERLFPWSMDYRRVMAFVPASLGGDPSPSTTPNAKAAIDAATELRAREGSTSAIALVALGQAYEAAGDKDRATRAYGSLADLYPERAEMLRAAAVRIARVRPGDPIAIDLLRRAASERPDQPSSHHLLCLELLRAGKPEAAFEAAANGMRRRYELRFASVSDLLATDLGLAAAAWAQAEPAKRDRIESKAIFLHARSRDRSTVQAIAAWETDTSDIDVQAFDAKGERNGATTSQALDGFGPEALDLATDVKRVSALNAVVRLQRKGSGGDVLGVVHVVRHDGKGNVTIDPRPFTIMNEGTVLDLGAL